MLYVFVDISIDVQHFVESVVANFAGGTRISLVGTIQFASAMQAAQSRLSGAFVVNVPQVKPLSPGEILGCTSPTLKDSDVVMCVLLEAWCAAPCV